MQLLDYMKLQTQKQLNELAASCKTSVGQLQQIAYGNRRCREALAINLERETKRAVTCEELRPDVDWAYIRATKKTKAA